MFASDLLLHRALELSAVERARLANALLESLEAEDEIEISWETEISKRRESLREDSASLIASEDLLRSISPK